jgi:oxygen-independent coproporphyrinogen III oxidase
MLFSPDDFSIYVHLPFCSKKCPYCSFYVIPFQIAKAKAYTDLVKKEWGLYRSLFTSKKLTSLYFGGGTPSLYPEGICALINAIGEDFDLSRTEITVEVNPENGSQKLFDTLKKGGVNRISIGAQTFDDALLKKIGRMHTAKETIDAINRCALVGISNISIDLMSELPGQTHEHITHTLDVIKTLPITHLSLYNLQIEPGTSFYKRRKQLEKELPKEKVASEMLINCFTSLEAMGFSRYEISAFAKEGKISKHNFGYWIGRPFLGLGASSFSYLDKERFQNIPHIGKYAKKIDSGDLAINFREKLCSQAALLELLALHFRLIKGFDLKAFQDHHGYLPKESLVEIEKLEKEQLIEKRKDLFALTPKGALFFDEVAPRLIH